MLKMYAKLLLEMLTNREDFETFDRLNISSELKCIIYECLQAEKKTLKREEERYHNEMQSFIEKEQRKMADRATQEETDLVAEFKELIEKQKQ